MRELLAAALFLVDGFTGLSVTDASIPVVCKENRRRIRKQDGYHIFLDNGEKILHLTIGGGIYQSMDLTIDLEALKEKKFPCLTIYLFPSNSYTFPPGIICEEIKEEEGLLPWEDTKDVVRLTKDYSAGDKSIFLKTRGTFFLEDRPLYLLTEDSISPVLIMLDECLDLRTGEYKLKKPLEFLARCQDSRFLLAYKPFSTPEKRYYIPHIKTK